MSSSTEIEEDKLDRDFHRNCRTLLEIFHGEHSKFLLRPLKGLGEGFVSLDASHTWLMYWCLNAMRILCLDNEIKRDIWENIRHDVQSQLLQFQNTSPSSIDKALNITNGGFGGGFWQISHLAPTFSAVQAAILTEQFDIIDRQALSSFIEAMKQPDGSFVMHSGGEVDLRASYCAIVVAYICNLLQDSITDQVAKFIGKCQTFEGGFAALPGMEAHGGYTFCGFATLVLLGRFDTVDLDALERWTVRRIANQGGFAGRCNKLVDSCYCYWIFALVPLLRYARGYSDNIIDDDLLVMYLLGFAQQETGGFADRYPNNADFYHTCYSLCAVSIAVNSVNIETNNNGDLTQCKVDNSSVLSQSIAPVHPLFGLPVDAVQKAYAYFHNN